MKYLVKVTTNGFENENMVKSDFHYFRTKVEAENFLNALDVKEMTAEGSKIELKEINK